MMWLVRLIINNDLLFHMICAAIFSFTLRLDNRW